MDILQYLIELLKTRKQIGIEGLGTFYKKKTPGRYDAETHSFLPPSYALEFSSDVLEHTNLSQYIQTKRGISEDSAKYFINQFVEEIHKGLQNGEYVLENVGTLKQTANELSFTVNQNINIGFDFFALPAVTADVQHIEPAPNETEQQIETTNQVSQIQEPAIEHTEVPEFEHEMARLGDEVTTETANPIEDHEPAEVQEDLQDEIALEESVAQPEEIKEVATDEITVESHEKSENTATSIEKSENITTAIESNEATDEEVYEEIAEVNTENPTGETWSFEGENVISDDDVYEEENAEESENTSNTETNAEGNDIDFIPRNDFNSTGKKDDFRLTSTTHEWDFDNVGNKVTEENTLIGEYDNDELDESFEEEKTTMPLYQKVSIGLLVLAVVLAIIYFVKPEMFQHFGKTDVNPNEKMVLPMERSDLKTQKDSLDFADSIMQNAEKVGLDVQPAKDTLKVITKKSEAKPIETYDIIAAAFARDSEVEEYIAYMKKHGFEAKVAKMPGKLYKKISIASYNNIDSAQKYVVKFRKQLKNPKMYVQTIKNN
ncbi:hypothetical protein [Pedobacter sp.]|uniref:hypothetical protein n=1 Tax=Pedobacter sp. TaxID=1411316 RepID=UPI0031D14CFE